MAGVDVSKATDSGASGLDTCRLTLHGNYGRMPARRRTLNRSMESKTWTPIFRNTWLAIMLDT